LAIQVTYSFFVSASLLHWRLPLLLEIKTLVMVDGRACNSLFYQDKEAVFSSCGILLLRAVEKYGYADAVVTTFFYKVGV
jgi:hypothetical protein